MMTTGLFLCLNGDFSGAKRLARAKGCALLVFSLQSDCQTVTPSNCHTVPPQCPGSFSLASRTFGFGIQEVEDAFEKRLAMGLILDIGQIESQHDGSERFAGHRVFAFYLSPDHVLGVFNQTQRCDTVSSLEHTYGAALSRRDNLEHRFILIGHDKGIGLVPVLTVCQSERVAIKGPVPG